MALTTGVHGSEVVAVEIDIQNADGYGALFERFDFAGQALGQRYAAAPNADERQPVQIGVLLQDFVRQPHQRAVRARGLPTSS